MQHPISSNLKARIALASVVLFATACTDSSGPTPFPEWGMNTNWAGSVTMSTGTVLTVTFTLVPYSGKDIFGGDDRRFIPNPSRLENKARGVSISGFGGEVDHRTGMGNTSFLLHEPFGQAIDGILPGCPAVPSTNNRPYYSLSFNLRDDGKFHGTIVFQCIASADTFDSRPIVIARI